MFHLIIIAFKVTNKSECEGRCRKGCSIQELQLSGIRNHNNPLIFDLIIHVLKDHFL